MKIYYDTEFVEDGKTIDLVSIGMVAEDGRELYAVSSEFSISGLLGNPWLAENVWPSLPLKKHDPGVPCQCSRRKNGHLDFDHPDVRPRAQIIRMVEAFILATPDVELWAWYSAYDHVALAQLWGRMIDLPKGVPMWTNDLKQECMRLGNPTMPKQGEGEHHALADARHVKVMAEFLARETHHTA
ncbi:3'-5' exoribonuclease [Microtetraspora sp. AC03309]|uniref:3'-5' exoribonuclease n=1 Tax=Microtetraspora sp. AC03309 TaxID=2779376 RepID=UPI001E3C3133|nr:3'-5' exoribonuclease [Microtetraspora sp. AC03309]MCC5580599.1 3'-5' exoribonuclease [Microtetraspora sp. AC03309]